MTLLTIFFVADDPENAEAGRHEQRLARMRIVAEQCPGPVLRDFYLFGVDTTTRSRPFAGTLPDRGFQYSPNPTPGNRPITVGHMYSVLASLPEKEGAMPPPWILPLLIQRVPTDKKDIGTGAAQLSAILTDEKLPFGNHLSAVTGDTRYSAREFLGETVRHENLVTIVRVRGDRVFYRMPTGRDSSGKRGHPVWYGMPFNLGDPSSGPGPDDTETFPFTFRNGRECQVTISAWYDMLMHGRRDIPMHKKPFTLIRTTVQTDDGKEVFGRPLWLIIIGKRRREISLTDAYHAYRQRYDPEHFFRFGKSRLLMASCQTPDAEHEENRWEIAGLAYVNLYTAAPLANNLPYPRERWLPNFKKPVSETLPSPSAVQRDLPRIIQEFGTPAKLPKPRGKSPGRQKGESPGRRNPLPVIKKGKRKRKKPARTI